MLLLVINASNNGLRMLINFPKYNSASKMFVNHVLVSCWENFYLVLRPEILNLTTHW